MSQRLKRLELNIPVSDQCLPSCESLRILAPSPPSLPGGLVSIFSRKYSLSLHIETVFCCLLKQMTRIDID